MRGGRLTEPTWRRLAARYTEAQLIELPLLVGAYTMLGYAQSTLRLDPPYPVTDRLTALLGVDWTHWRHGRERELQHIVRPPLTETV